MDLSLVYCKEQLDRSSEPSFFNVLDLLLLKRRPYSTAESGLEIDVTLQVVYPYHTRVPDQSWCNSTKQLSPR